MTLTLEITASAEGNPRDSRRHVFGEDGGSIGRATSNAWILSHNKVSGRHAQVSFRNGVFYIQDTSRNGVSVNSPENRLGKNRPYALKAGDRIFIAPDEMGDPNFMAAYEIDVWIDAGSERRERPAHVDPFADDDPFGSRDVPLREASSPLPESPANEEVDPLKFFDPIGGRTARKAEPPPRPGDDLLDAHYQPPAIVPSPPPPAPFTPVAIPQGYDPLSPDEPVSEPPAPPPPPVPPPPPPPVSPPIRPRPGDSSVRRRFKEPPSAESTVRHPVHPPVSVTPPPAEPVVQAPPVAPAPVVATPPPAGQTADLAELLAGAGVPDATVTPQLTRSLGEILRIVVAGLMDVLQSRQRIKEEFRMQQTLFRPSENNPLKFSANVEDALHNLLVKRNPAYLGPVDAFADAFDDLRDHQLAMLAGMRVAFEAMLAEFDADKLQEEFDAQLRKLSLPLMPAKLRYWEMYRDRGGQLAKDAEATFDRLFGEEFKRAYEEQFRKLKAQRRARAKPESEPPPLPK